MTVLLHDFLGHPDDWNEFLQQYPFEAKALTLPGHTDVPPLTQNSLKALAHYVSNKIPDGSTLIGHSLGGRVALQLALDFPQRIAKLVLISSSPGIRESSARTARQEKDHLWAKELESDFDTFLFHWYSQPQFAGFENSEFFLPAMKRRSKHNPLLLSRILLETSPGLNPSNWDVLGKLNIPVLYVSGNPEDTAIAREMIALNPRITLEDLSSAGHALPLTHAKNLTEIIKNWIGH